MTSTNLQSKRNEHGASLILLVSIVGLAFIVTIGAFLAAASVERNTVRFTSAKMDVANREDVLMRAILQQTATAIFTTDSTGKSPTWNTIMNNAVDAVDAVNDPTKYVDTAELTALGIDAIDPKVISANTGDTNNSANPLDIFNGYQTEVPFGGTSGPGLANDVSLDPKYTQAQRAVDPPLMIWSGDLALSSTTALTTPQELFFGSRYTPLSLPSGTPLSASYRWAQLPYSAIRFGYKPSRSPFVARRIWWRIPLAYTQKPVNGIDLINRYPTVPTNYVLSVYEIPSQLPISGNANLQIGAWGNGSTVAITGSIYGGKIQLYGGTYNSVSSQQQVNVVNPATVGGVAYSESTDSAFDQPGTQPGTREQIASTQPGGVAAPVSVAGNDGKVLIVPVLPFGIDGRPSANEFYNAAPGAPTNWDLYARPYYKCRIRVILNDTANPATVTINYQPDTANPPQPDQILGFKDPLPYSTGSFSATAASTNGNDPASRYGINYTNNILVVDVFKMVQALGKDSGTSPAQLYSIYFSTTNSSVAIRDTRDLSAFTSGLSIVTNQTLYLLDAFNQGTQQPPTRTQQPPTSIYAPHIRYGIRDGTSTVSPQVKLTGQMAMVVPTPSPNQSPTPMNPLSFTSGDTSPVPSSNITAVLSEVTDPTPWSSTTSPTTGLPPITALNLLFTIEKEQIN
jgi:hypothetical protein